MYSDTVELRWFKRGEIPERVRDWFFPEKGNGLEQAPRTDYYHCQLASGRLGTKLREDLIEVKQLQDYVGKWTGANGKIQGRLEKWRKWSFNLCVEKSVVPAIQGSRDWIAIEKKRWLHYYTLAGDQITATELPGNTNNGCILELSEILHNKSHWWTLCFEAFGKPEQLVVAIHQVANKIIPGDVHFDLSEDDNASYPEWLEKIMHK